MFKKKKTYIILILIIGAIGGFYYWKNRKPKVEYTTSEAYRGTLAQTVSVTGKLVPPEEVNLSFKSNGRVEKMLVDVGDHVKKGQKIAVIDKGTLLAQLRQAEYNVRVEKNNLEDIERRDETYNYDNIQGARARKKAAEQDVAAIREQLSELAIYSPVDGIVTVRNFVTGETISANSAAANQPVVTIAKDGEIQIESNVPESDIIKISLDLNADATLDAFSTKEVFPVKVAKIEPAATVIQDVVYYRVKLAFISPDGRFRNGMSADVDIHTTESQNAVIVPLRAVKTEGDQKYVEVLNADGLTTRRVNITTGLEGDEGMVEVKSGLSGGEKVVTFTKTP